MDTTYHIASALILLSVAIAWSKDGLLNIVLKLFVFVWALIGFHLCFPKLF